MCNRCLVEEECLCLKEAMENVKSPEGLSFIKDFLTRQRELRRTTVKRS